MNNTTPLFLFLGLCCWFQGFSQISITRYGEIYQQDFNTLASSGSANFWTNNSTLPGWYSNNTSYTVDDGSSSAVGLKSYGNNTTDRALGAITSSTGSSTYVAVVFQNNTDTILSYIDFKFNLEMWRCTAGSGSIRYAYKQAATWNGDIINNFYDLFQWTTISQSCSPGAVDGNLSVNQEEYATTLGGILPGEYFIFRIEFRSCSSCDRGVAIDDFQAQFFPNFQGPYFRSNGRGGGHAFDYPTWQNAYYPNGPFFDLPPFYFNLFYYPEDTDRVQIMPGDSVYINSSYNWWIDDVIVEEGGILGIHDNAIFSINDKNLDCNKEDFTLNGKLYNTTVTNGFNYPTFGTPGQWRMGPRAEIHHKSLQDFGFYGQSYVGECFFNYGSGIAQIPSTSIIYITPPPSSTPYYFNVDYYTLPNVIIDNPNTTLREVWIQSNIHYDSIRIKGDLKLGSNGNPLEVYMINNSSGQPNILGGNLVIGPNTLLSNSNWNWGAGIKLLDGDIYISGNGKLDFSTSLNYYFVPSLVFEGSTRQLINAPDSAVMVAKLEIDNPTEVMFTGDLAVMNEIDFSQGILSASNGAKLIMEETFGAPVYVFNTNAPNSYINAPIRQYFMPNFNQYFTFELGSSSSSSCDYNPFDITLYSWAFNSSRAYLDLAFNPNNQMTTVPLIDTCNNYVYVDAVGSWDLQFSSLPLDSINIYLYPQDYCRQLSGTSYTVAKDGALPICNQYNRYVSGGTFEFLSGQALSALAVDFTAFRAWRDKDYVQLAWEIEVPNPISTYHIERSSNGFAFQSIGQIKGNEELTVFNFQDSNPLPQINYYRIQEKATDGTSTLSEIRKVEFKEVGVKVQIAPNLIKQQLNITVMDGFEKPKPFKVVSAQGKVMGDYHLEAQTQQKQINVNHLATGMYFIQWLDPNLPVLKFLKE